MKLVVISPEHDDPRENAVLGQLFAAGLERYHVRKPHASAAQLEIWLGSLPHEWRARIVLHHHHELVGPLGLGGQHWRDIPGTATAPGRTSLKRSGAIPVPILTSRSCHDLVTLRAALGDYDSVFFGPVFSSLSKPGYGPRKDFSFTETFALLAARTAAERRTSVLALGGITAETAPRALAMGFDGVTVLGAIWLAADPIRAFAELRNAVQCSAEVRRLVDASASLATPPDARFSHA